jgi:serine/threonine protein kinase
MPLAAGDKLGPYEILTRIGAGGMGEVWKARDTRLGRIVAVKRLKGSHSARFEHESRTIAALNNPHICQIYDVGPDYLVMEYIDGAPFSFIRSSPSASYQNLKQPRNSGRFCNSPPTGSFCELPAAFGSTCWLQNQQVRLKTPDFLTDSDSAVCCRGSPR